MPLKESFKKFYYEPFDFVDNLKIEIRGNNLNIFQKYKRVRKTAFGIALICLVAWALFGFDSTPLQFVHVLIDWTAAIKGEIPWSEFDPITIYNRYYGKEMHYSAFVIYGLMYWALSRHFENHLGIKGAKNVAYSSALVFFSVAIFEFYWMYSFAYFQNQWWVVSFKMPQLRIFLQNVIFLAVGSAFVLYIWADSYIIKNGKVTEERCYHYNWNWKSIILIALSLFFLISWWFYPFYVEQITVRDENTGYEWTNSRNFPNTLYTVDTNPHDGINAGVWFYVQNDLVHAWNTIAKIILTFTVYYIAKVRRIE